MMNSSITVRMDSGLKHDFSHIVEELGLDAPTVIRMLVKQTVQAKRIPLSLSLVSQEEKDMRFLDNVRADWGKW
jgi:addiction module RelB/DinJ family antitoxin